MTTITLKDGALQVQTRYEDKETIKRLAPGTRAWDGASKVWTVDALCFEEVLELFPDATVSVEVWEHIYPSFGKRVPEVIGQCQRWADSGVVLLRDGDKLVAHHDHAPASDLKALQPYVDAMAADINALLIAGIKVPGVIAEAQVRPEDEKLFAFMQTIKKHRKTWEGNAHKKRMMAKGRYGK